MLHYTLLECVTLNPSAHITRDVTRHVNELLVVDRSFNKYTKHSSSHSVRIFSSRKHPEVFACMFGLDLLDLDYWMGYSAGI